MQITGIILGLLFAIGSLSCCIRYSKLLNENPHSDDDRVSLRASEIDDEIGNPYSSDVSNSRDKETGIKKNLN